MFENHRKSLILDYTLFCVDKSWFKNDKNAQFGPNSNETFWVIFKQCKAMKIHPIQLITSANTVEYWHSLNLSIFFFIFQYNMNRRYGLEGLPQLFANFKQVYTDLKLLSSQMNEIGLSDSLFVLEKASTIEELFDIENKSDY